MEIDIPEEEFYDALFYFYSVLGMTKDKKKKVGGKGYRTTSYPFKSNIRIMKRIKKRTKNIKVLRKQIKDILSEVDSSKADLICFSEIVKNLNNDENLDKNLKELGCDNESGMCYYYNNHKRAYQYLPNPLPKKKADIFLICKEPSISSWAKNQEEAEDEVDNKGNQNFIDCDLFDFKQKEVNRIKNAAKKNNSILIEKSINGVNILFTALLNAYRAKNKCEPSIYITDLSKCAMDVNEADSTLIDKEGNKLKFKDIKLGKEALIHRYGCCSNLLKWEIENISQVENTHFVFVGKTSFFTIQNKSKEKYKVLLENFLLSLNTKIDINKTSHIPHYALQNLPPSLLDIFYDTDEDIIKAKDEIKEVFINLGTYKYYMDNFYFSKDNKKILSRSIDNLRNHSKEINVRVSNISLILYTIYKKHFEKLF